VIKIGAKRYWKNKSELSSKIESYFAECKVPTVAGLAYAAGFRRVRDMREYPKNRADSDELMRAILFVESFVEERLLDKTTSSGAKFDLVNRFEGWSEGKPEERPQEESNLKEALEESANALGKAEPQTAESYDLVD
jgi:hypothetical protein